MRRWIGLWTAAVAALHFVAAFAIYPAAIPAAAAFAFNGSIPPKTIESEAFWFVAFAPILLLVGLLVDRFERRGERLGWLVPSVLAVTLVGLIVPMPETGAWLLVPAAIALFVREHRLSRRAE